MKLIPSKGSLIMVLSIILIPNNCNAILHYGTTYVSIRNYLRDAPDLTVHCKSRDDDLGVQVIPYCSHWQFHFRPNLWGSTFFFCSFAWGIQSHYFDIYVQERDQGRCSICIWSITLDGPCMLNVETGTFNLCELWNPPSASQKLP